MPLQLLLQVIQPSLPKFVPPPSGSVAQTRPAGTPVLVSVPGTSANIIPFAMYHERNSKTETRVSKDGSTTTTVEKHQGSLEVQRTPDVAPPAIPTSNKTELGASTPPRLGTPPVRIVLLPLLEVLVLIDSFLFFDRYRITLTRRMIHR